MFVLRVAAARIVLSREATPGALNKKRLASESQHASVPTSHPAQGQRTGAAGHPDGRQGGRNHYYYYY